MEDFHIKNRVSGKNRYYIDENLVLWGYGFNDYGQLGIGTVDSLDTFYTEPIRIAENVVSVDASINGYFCIYLTEEGNLYGMGSNMLGLLGQEYDTAAVFSVNEYNEVPSPVLLMENVAYVRAGRESIVALDKEGNVWWWGQYKTTYLTRRYNRRSDWPGWFSLYMGSQHFWECGAEVTSDDFLRTPKKTLENVCMVWPEKIFFNSLEEEIPQAADYRTTYSFNTFALLDDGTVVAAGKDIGDKEKEIAVTGDLVQTTSHVYSDTFLPVTLEEFSIEKDMQRLRALSWGMRPEEVEQMLVQRDGSRNPSFTMGMSLEEVKERLDCNLITVTNSDIGTTIYWTESPVDGSYLGFVFHDNALCQVWETADKESGFF